MTYYEVGIPERILINNEQQYQDFLLKYNRRKNIYFTVYHFDKLLPEGKPDIESVKFDKVFFDFDEDDCYTKTITFHEYLRNRNLKHEVLLSGRGFHIILYLKNGEKIKNKKQCLANIHNYFDNKFTLHLDKHVIGDLSRLRRIPNTLNLKNKRYCIYLCGEDLSNGFDYIKKKAGEPNAEHTVFGRFAVDAEAFKDKNDISFNGVEVLDFDYNYNEKTGDELFDKFPPCIKEILTNTEKCHYDGRYFACLYCKSIGLPKNVTFEIMKRYLSKMPDDKYRNKLGHLVKHKTLQYAYSRTQDIIPSCSTNYKSGRCSGKCKWYKEKDFPLIL